MCTLCAQIVWSSISGTALSQGVPMKKPEDTPTMTTHNIDQVNCQLGQVKFKERRYGSPPGVRET